MLHEIEIVVRMSSEYNFDKNRGGKMKLTNIVRSIYFRELELLSLMSTE